MCEYEMLLVLMRVLEIRSLNCQVQLQYSEIDPYTDYSCHSFHIPCENIIGFAVAYEEGL